MKSPEVTKATFTDPRDGKTYKTVEIGEQVCPCVALRISHN